MEQAGAEQKLKEARRKYEAALSRAATRWPRTWCAIATAMRVVEVS